MPYISLLNDNTVLLHLHVQPKASKNRIAGIHDGCLKLAVASPPVEGRANKEVVKFLAAVLGVSGRDVILKSGDQSRRKRVLVKSLGAAEIRNAIEKKIANHS